VLRDWPEEGFCGNVLFQPHYSSAAEIFQGPRKPDFSALSAPRKPRAGSCVYEAACRCGCWLARWQGFAAYVS